MNSIFDNIFTTYNTFVNGLPYKEYVFINIVLINTIVSIIYLITSAIIFPLLKRKNTKKKKEDNTSRIRTFIYFFVMLVCPVVGISFLVFSYILFRVVFHNSADLSDVIFSKEKKAATERADIEKKLHIASLEESISVSDKNSLRKLMMNVIKGDVLNSLAAISLALNSEDSETSHYAASVLSDELNIFRESVEKLYIQIIHAEEDPLDDIIILIEYLNKFLVQRVFIQMEQEYFVMKMVEMAEMLISKAKMKSLYFEWICIRLLELKKFELTEIWCHKAMEIFPMDLSSYTCYMKLYFTTLDREKFFHVVDSLKRTNIVIDNETLELIRIFR